MAAIARDDAWDLFCEWTASDSLRKHALAVEAGMRAYAERYGEDPEPWAVTALVHDLDYERFPDLDTGHPRRALEELSERGYPQGIIDAVAGHADFMGVPRETLMAKALYAVDEMSGFVTACALVRPTGIEGMKPKSVRKKMKQPSFAAAVDRDQLRRAAEQLGVELDEHIGVVISALAANAEVLGLTPREDPAGGGVKRRWKILLAILAGLAVLLGLNTIVLDRETKQAEVTVPGGKILSLNGGDLQVLDLPPTSSRPQPGGPVVLLHCYTCAIDWWDRLIPLLRRHHRVIAIDLLGHGGSEKPSDGYSMPEQADLIAEALGRLGVRGATVVGHSLGGTVATALAQQSPDLVSRLVLIDQAPDNSYGQLGLLARLTYWPVLGEALWRITPNVAIKDALGQAFAPGFDVPDQFVDDVRRMTFNAYDTIGAEEDDYTKQEPLDARIRATGIPLLAIFGDEDQIYDARRALSAYAAIRGARTDLIKGAGHSPNVEKPTQVAKLIESFAAPEPEPQKLTAGGSVNSTTARCQTAIAGAGRSDWRGKSAVAGPLGLFGGGRDFSTAQRVGPGTLQTKIPAIVNGHGRVVLRVPEREQGRVGLLWGRAALAGGRRRVGDAFDRVVFIPCGNKPRTVWPGGLLLRDRRPIALRVATGGRTYTARIG